MAVGAELFAVAPGLLLEQHSEHGGFSVVGGLEPFGGVVESGVAELRGEGENSFVVDRDAGEEHPSSEHLLVSDRVSGRKGDVVSGPLASTLGVAEWHSYTIGAPALLESDVEDLLVQIEPVHGDLAFLPGQFREVDVFIGRVRGPVSGVDQGVEFARRSDMSRSSRSAASSSRLSERSDSIARLASSVGVDMAEISVTFGIDISLRRGISGTAALQDVAAADAARAGSCREAVVAVGGRPVVVADPVGVRLRSGIWA